MTEKSRIGIPVTVLGAFIYFSGISGSTLIMVGLILYVLLFEDSEFLKNAAKLAFVFLLLFSIIFGIYGLVGRVVSLIGNVSGNSYVVPSIIQTVLNLIEYVVYFVFGMEALLGRNINVTFLKQLSGSLTEENISAETKKDAVQIGDGNIKFCLNCGTKLRADASFCTKCGEVQKQ